MSKLYSSIEHDCEIANDFTYIKDNDDFILSDEDYVDFISFLSGNHLHTPELFDVRQRLYKSYLKKK